MRVLRGDHPSRVPRVAALPRFMLQSSLGGAGRNAAEQSRLDDRCGARLGLLAEREPEGSSSTGRAPVSKTEGCGFESLLPCSTTMTMNRAEQL